MQKRFLLLFFIVHLGFSKSLVQINYTHEVDQLASVSCDNFYEPLSIYTDYTNQLALNCDDYDTLRITYQPKAGFYLSQLWLNQSVFQQWEQNPETITLAIPIQGTGKYSLSFELSPATPVILRVKHPKGLTLFDLIDHYENNQTGYAFAGNHADTLHVWKERAVRISPKQAFTTATLNGSPLDPSLVSYREIGPLFVEDGDVLEYSYPQTDIPDSVDINIIESDSVTITNIMCQERSLSLSIKGPHIIKVPSSPFLCLMAYKILRGGVLTNIIQDSTNLSVSKAIGDLYYSTIRLDHNTQFKFIQKALPQKDTLFIQTNIPVKFWYATSPYFEYTHLQLNSDTMLILEYKERQPTIDMGFSTDTTLITSIEASQGAPIKPWKSALFTTEMTSNFSRNARYNSHDLPDTIKVIGHKHRNVHLHVESHGECGAIYHINKEPQIIYRINSPPQIADTIRIHVGQALDTMLEAWEYETLSATAGSQCRLDSIYINGEHIFGSLWSKSNRDSWSNQGLDSIVYQIWTSKVDSLLPPIAIQGIGSKQYRMNISTIDITGDTILSSIDYKNNRDIRYNLSSMNDLLIQYNGIWIDGVWKTANSKSLLPDYWKDTLHIKPEFTQVPLCSVWVDLAPGSNMKYKNELKQIEHDTLYQSGYVFGPCNSKADFQFNSVHDKTTSIYYDDQKIDFTALNSNDTAIVTAFGMYGHFDTLWQASKKRPKFSQSTKTRASIFMNKSAQKIKELFDLKGRLQKK